MSFCVCSFAAFLSTFLSYPLFHVLPRFSPHTLPVFMLAIHSQTATLTILHCASIFHVVIFPFHIFSLVSFSLSDSVADANANFHDRRWPLQASEHRPKFIFSFSSIFCFIFSGFVLAFKFIVMVNYYYYFIGSEDEEHIMKSMACKSVFTIRWMLDRSFAADASCGHTFCIQINKVLTSPPLSREFSRSSAENVCVQCSRRLCPVCVFVSHNFIYYCFRSHESVEQLITHTQRSAHMGFFHIQKLHDKKKTRGNIEMCRSGWCRVRSPNQPINFILSCVFISRVQWLWIRIGRSYRRNVYLVEKIVLYVFFCAVFWIICSFVCFPFRFDTLAGILINTHTLSSSSRWCIAVDRSRRIHFNYTKFESTEVTLREGAIISSLWHTWIAFANFGRNCGRVPVFTPKQTKHIKFNSPLRDGTRLRCQKRNRCRDFGGAVMRSHARCRTTAEQQQKKQSQRGDDNGTRVFSCYFN